MEIFVRYKKKLACRNSRMPGFVRKFILTRLIKSLFLLITFPSLICLIRLRSVDTILYRPDNRHLKLFEGKNNILVIGSRKDARWAADNKLSFCYFHPFYAFSNLGFSFLWTLIFHLVKPKRIVVWTDYGLDQFLAIFRARCSGVRVWCYQHGLFPSNNCGDLDGMDADINVVSSVHQANILRRSGFFGGVRICDQLFSNVLGVTKKTNDGWIASGRPVIFVGPGFSHDPIAERHLLSLLKDLKKILGCGYTLIYRPHPRDKSIFDKLKSFGIPYVSDETTFYTNPSARVFIGVKSTLLLESQNVGDLVILLTSKRFPKYFESGEIFHEIDADDLGQILYFLTELENDQAA